ncbi:SusC/RagA family TonB-linked outer membrane protein [Gemmatimonadota bacterium]
MRSIFLSLLLIGGLSAASFAESVPITEPEGAPTGESAVRPAPFQGTVTGRVTDGQTGEPISAVQIFIEAAQIGVLTQENGRFLIQNVPDGTHTLSAQRIGYATASAEITVVAGGTVIQDFVMTPQAVAMDEMVVTGVPGGTRVRAIGNSVENVRSAGITRVAPISDVQGVLQGRAPGVNMMGGGVVGQTPRMRIRGVSAFSLAGQPLIYIDGVRANNRETQGYMGGNNSGVRGVLSTLDPEQIEEIEVLKGPAAATLYGTEASRGVINIITKRGQESGPQVDMMIRQGLNFMANQQDKIGYDNYWTNPATGEILKLNMLDHIEETGRELFGAGPVQTYNATLRGGSEETQYMFSGTYAKEVGVLSHNWTKRLNLRSNIDTRLFDQIAVSLTMGYTNHKDRLLQDGYASAVEGVEFGSPRYLPEYRCQTNPGFGCDLMDGFIKQGMPSRDRSLRNKQTLDRFTGGVTFNHTAFGWLTTRLTTGLDYTGELNTWFRGFQENDTTIYSLGANAAKGFRNEARWSHLLTTTDVSATADLGLTSKLTTATSVGVQYYTRTYSYLRATGQQFAGPGLSTITATAIQGTPENNSVGNNTLGSYVQETLAWQDRLFLTGAVRVDNNSAFGDEIDWVTYPKASLSWVLSEEGWFEDAAPDWLSTLRLRAAWGESGESPAAFSALRTWSPVTGPGNTAGVTPTTSGNPDLTAEVGQETEVGFDSDLFDGRLGLQFTYYHKLTKGAILSRDLPPSSGFTGNQFVNAGRIVNDGLEVALNANLIGKPSLRWDVGFNLSYNNGEIQQLSGEQGDTTIVFNSWSSMEHRVGYAPYSWFGVDVVSADVDATGTVLSAMCRDLTGGTTPCFDSSGNVIAPRVELAPAIAPWEMSFSTDVAVGENLRFHALFTSMQGHKRFDNTMRQRYKLYRIARENFYPEEMDPLMAAALKGGDRIIDPWVNDASFIRLKELSATYELPESYIQGFGMSRATIQIAGRNLLTFTDWTGSDPEVMFTSGSRAFMAQNNLPLPQQIVTSIRFSF